VSSVQQGRFQLQQFRMTSVLETSVFGGGAEIPDDTVHEWCNLNQLGMRCHVVNAAIMYYVTSLPCKLQPILYGGGAQGATALTRAVPPDPATVIQPKSNPYRLGNRFRMT